MRLKRMARGSAAVALATALAAAALGASASADQGGSVSAPDDGSVANAGALPAQGFGPSQRQSAIASYQRSAATTAAQLGLASGSGLSVKDVVQDADGTAHVRYTRTYKGLPVIGGDLVVHGAQTGSTSDVTWDDAGNFTGVGTTPTVSAAQAGAAAGAGAGKPQQVVYAIGGAPRLAWKVSVPVADGLHQIAIIDATTGADIVRYDDEQTSDAFGTGKTLYSGDVRIRTDKLSATSFAMQDNTRGGHRVTSMNGTTSSESATLTDADNVWGDNTESDPNTVAADAQYGAAVTWDYYQSLGRNGIRNDGVGARSRVHYGVNYDNAFWSDACFCMTYGDGNTFTPLVPLDVAGHEMTHGVTSNTAGLNYYGESGGLNEATSDIFGTMVEFKAANANDPGDYYIGEKIASSLPGGALRRMDTPSLDGVSYDCYEPLMGRDDPHYTSGVANHFYYLLSEGSAPKTIGGRAHSTSACNGATVTGITRSKADKIWYRALTVYMVAGSDYRDARDATIRAARDLYGPTSTQCKRVVSAWSAVSVQAGNWTCAGETIPSTGTNAVTNGDFEAASTGAGWTQSPAGIVVGSADARSGGKVAYLRGYGTAGTDTLSQTVTVPGTTSPKLVFHLLVSSAEGSTTTIYDTFKVQVVKGGVTKTVFNSNNAQWDDSYHRKSVDLAAYAGQSVTLKFVGLEDSSASTAFLLDDVSLR